MYIIKCSSVSATSSSARVAVKELDRGDIPTGYIFNDSGYSDAEVWEAVLEFFFKMTAGQRSENLDIELMLDNHASHRTAKACALCLKHNCHVIFLPANCTHFLQPLDDIVFTRYKQELLNRAASTQRFQTIHFKTMAETLMAVSASAVEVAFRKDLIIASWRNTGLWPFDNKLINTRATEYADPKNATVTTSNQKKFHQMCQAYQKTSPTVQKVLSVKVPNNKKKQVMFGSEVIALHDKDEQEAKEKEEAKKVRQLQQATKKQVNEEKKKIRQQERQQKKKEQQEKADKKRKRQEEEQHDREQKRKKEENACRCCDRQCRHNTKEKWHGCEHCEFWVCNRCYESAEIDGQSILQQHEHTHDDDIADE